MASCKHVTNIQKRFCMQSFVLHLLMHCRFLRYLAAHGGYLASLQASCMKLSWTDKHLCTRRQATSTVCTAVSYFATIKFRFYAKLVKTDGSIRP